MSLFMVRSEGLVYESTHVFVSVWYISACMNKRVYVYVCARMHVWSVDVYVNVCVQNVNSRVHRKRARLKMP